MENAPEAEQYTPGARDKPLKSSVSKKFRQYKVDPMLYMNPRSLAPVIEIAVFFSDVPLLRV